MKILVAYWSQTGNTKKVAEFRKCTTIGHRVEDRIDAETLEQLKAFRADLDGRNPG